MSLLKNAVIAPLAIAAMAASLGSQAAQIRHTIQLEASVPSSSFLVQPVDPDLVGKVNKLNWNPGSETLDSLRAPFYAKHTAGSIEASVLELPVLSSANDSITLKVKFNGEDLGTAPVPVLNAAEAALAPTVYLDIEPVKPTTGGYKEGVYVGNVNLAFDAVLTPTP
jgi:hypothetical protein